MTDIQLATVLRGAQSFKEGNVNETFRGQILTSDGTTRQCIIKDLSLIQLCNELLAHTIAHEVNLPIPDCYLGLVRGNTLTVRNAPELRDGSRLVFVSVDVKVPNVTFRLRGLDAAGLRTLLDRIINWGDLGHLYAYDAWIANIDRHQGNLLFGGDSEFWLIDHGHSFTGPAWQPSQLDPEGDYLSRLSEWVTGSLSSNQKNQRAQEVNKFSADISGFDATDVSKSSLVAQLLPEAEVKALKNFVEKRVNKISVQAGKALGVPTIV